MGNWGSNGANPKKERIVMLGLDNAGAEITENGNNIDQY